MSLYDYPHYYDLVYGSDWKAEIDFLTGVFDKHVCGEIKQPARAGLRYGKVGYFVCNVLAFRWMDSISVIRRLTTVTDVLKDMDCKRQRGSVT